ncbi:MAG TPA: cell envelope integrity protein TolA, partial [Cyclobacteriaceae bacterium]|nr:cell envelope integrity protein TolA [Cyclobacteriaceae bacterium]
MASKDSNEGGTNDPVDNSSDNFGLPDLDYKPLDQPTTEAPETHTPESVAAPEPTPSHSYETESRSTDMGGMDGLEEPKSKSPAILIVAVVLVVVAAGYLIYNFVWAPRAEAQRLAKEKQAKELALQKKQKEEAEARAKQEAEERRRQQELANAKPVIGTIETLTAPTRRY